MRTRKVVLRTLCVALAIAGCVVWQTRADHAAPGPQLEAAIEVDANQVTGKVPRYLFGQFIEHEHNTIDNGVLAELLQNRKFDEDDRDGNGVSNRWVPEERVQDHY